MLFAEQVESNGAVIRCNEIYARNNRCSPPTLAVQYYNLTGVPTGNPKAATSVPANRLASFMTNALSNSELGPSFRGRASASSSGNVPVSLYSPAWQGSGVRLFG